MSCRAASEVMKIKKPLLVGLASLAVTALASYASVVAGDSTFRTTGYFLGISQATNQTKPQYDEVSFTDANLVNLAEGRSVTNKTVPNQVLAVTFANDLSSFSLVVYDTNTSSIVTTIATSSTVSSVLQQDPHQAGPNRAHFVALLQLGQNGNSSNGLTGGFLTVSGRVNLNPTNGIPSPVVLSFDIDPFDQLDGIGFASQNTPPAARQIYRTGLAQATGVIDAVINGATSDLLVPFGGLNFGQELTVAPLDLD
jgi:hypothetical protein